MRDPFSWSMPFGRLFGVNIRIHILFPLIVLAMILRYSTHEEAVEGVALQAAILMAILFFSVLLHEFGHCFGARAVEGDAQEILLWPLGGLASVDVPHTPRANFITAACGPAVNLMLCVASGATLALVYHFTPPFNPWWNPLPVNIPHSVELGGILVSQPMPVLLARVFWLNWFLFLLNVCLPGFPLDGGRMLQCLLWPRYGYRLATEYAIYAGFGVMFVIGVYSIIVVEPLFIFLAWFIYTTCKNQWLMLETGGEESLFGYDFTQGYTSLERDEATPPRRRRQSFWQRWKQKRAAKRMQREQQEREAEERRMDELLEKVKREGLNSLTAEERRFLERVSARYRNRS
ncbi:MAG: hypothetical protein KatS3mg105_2827 [Gemmatales bacterium]|nr:MAG: hypothetical protein KatS3mg105_2827 [Gemmatales bacterium]